MENHAETRIPRLSSSAKKSTTTMKKMMKKMKKTTPALPPPPTAAAMRRTSLLREKKKKREEEEMTTTTETMMISRRKPETRKMDFEEEDSTLSAKKKRRKKSNEDDEDDTKRKKETTTKRGKKASPASKSSSSSSSSLKQQLRRRREKKVKEEEKEEEKGDVPTLEMKTKSDEKETKTMKTTKMKGEKTTLLSAFSSQQRETLAKGKGGGLPLPAASDALMKKDKTEKKKEKKKMIKKTLTAKRTTRGTKKKKEEELKDSEDADEKNRGGKRSGGGDEQPTEGQDVSMMREDDIDEVDRGEDFGDDDEDEDADDEEYGGGGDDYHDDEEDEDDEDIDDDDDEEEEEYSNEDDEDDDNDSEDEGRRGGGDRHDGGLHALLSRLGGAMEGMGGGSRGGISARLKDVLKALTFDREAENGGIDDTAIVIALNELCEIVVTSSEELLATSLSPEPFAKALLNCCNLEHNPELMLLAVRAMTSMADILPNTRGAFVRAGALPTLCQKLFAIEYIDVAEQSLSALEKLTRGYYGSKAAEAGALTAALAHLDFFGVGMQGVSMQMASNVCSEFPTKSLSPGAVDAIPTLLSLLVRDDQKVATLACNCLVSLSVKAKKLADRRVSFLLQKEKEQKEQQQLLLDRQPSATKKEEERGGAAAAATTTARTTDDAATSNDRQKKKKEKSSSSEMDPAAANETVSLILSDALCERCLEIVREAAGTAGSTSNVTHSRLLYRGCVKILATILEARPEMSIFLLNNGVAQILAEHLERCKIVRANVGVSEYSPVQSMDDLHDAMHLIGLLIPSQVKRNDEIKKTSVSLVVGAADLQKLFAKPENASLVAIFGEYLAPTLCHVAESPSNVTIKRKALSTLTAWTQLVDIETFENVARDEAPIAAVVARALIDPQGELLKEAAKLCAMTLEKSNEENQEEEAEFIKRFAKEGGAHALEVRAKEYNFLIAEAAEKSAGSEEKTLLHPTTPREPQFQMSTNPKEEGLRICSEVRNQYFGPGKAHLIASEGLDRLRKACAKLKTAPLSDSSEGGKSAKNPRDAKEFSSAFAKIFEALATSEISAFELSECGAASTLRKFLCASDVPSSPKTSSPKSRSIDCEEATERLAIFTRAAGDAPTGSFETLVRLLVETLQTRERMPISVSEHATANSDSSYARFRASSGAPSSLAPSANAGDPGLNLLARPLKVRLKRASKCDATKVEDYGNSVVMIEPLAQLSAVEAFLYSRVKKKPVPAQQPPNASYASASAPNADANRSASAPDREMDHDEEDFDEEEDYDDMDEEDFHDEEDDDMDDMDHEEDYMDDEDDEENLLGPEGEDTAHPPASAEEIAAPPASSPSPPPPSQQEQSATAATARVPTPQASSARGAAAGRSFASVAAGSDIARPRLAFSVNDGDAYIQDTKNVLAAVTQVSIGDSVKPMSGRLWEQPCVLYYDIVDTTDPKFEGIISEGGEDSNDSSKPATLVETVVEENLFANPSVKSDVKAILGPVASTVFNAQFGHPNVVKGLEDDFVRDALATLTLCHLVTEDAKKILRTAGPEKIKSAAVHAQKTSDNMLVNGDDDEDKMLLSADRMRIANLSSAKMHAENLFLAPKLSGKLRAQLRDTLSVCARRVPEWTSALAKTCPWLFTLDERVLLFHCASFSVARALHQLHGDGKASNGANGNAANAGAANAGGDPRGGARVGRLQRQKVRIRREHALSSAIKVFSSPQTRKHVLEVEFYDEVGTGIGPTNEFYALVSKDLQRASHGIFRSEHSATTTTKTDNAESLVNAPHGLFPKPFRAVPNASKAIEIFRCVGRAIGKVLQDGRLLDVKFNPNFFKKLYGLPLCLDDLELLEPELFSTLKKLETAVRDGSGRLDGAKIEDLCLEFALPDGANIEGASVADEVVTAENASRYIAAVVDDVLGAGVEPLFQACREGFADIVSNPSQLAMFSLSEIDALTCGVDEQTKWSERDLREHILCDHGYQVNSKPVVNLREILTNMSDAERRSFLKFTTGSPRLPIGGLASLNPKLKVVCKQPTVLSEVGGGMNAAEMISEGTELADADLPSAMTCANYLKLPPYSSKEALELKLKLAISEGVGSFDLS
ncbi:unnamed protein product [Bathycoccus prasinos]